MTNQKTPSDTPPPPRPVVIALTGGLLLLNLFVISLLGLGVFMSKQQSEERARTTTQNLALALEQDLADQIGKIDLALFALAQEYKRQNKQGFTDPTAMKEAILAIRSRFPEIDILSITNAAGDVTNSADVGSDIKLNVGDRDYFLQLKDRHDDRLLVSKPVISRLDGQWTLMFLRRLSDANGSFAGGVQGGLLIERFHRQFAALEIGKESMVSLRDSQLNLIARYPMPQRLHPNTGEMTATPQLRSSTEKNLRAGTYVAKSLADGIERLVSYRQIGDYPLLVSVGLSENEYLSGWRNDLVKASVTAFLFLLLSSIAVRLILRSWQRQLAALGKLSHGEARLRMVAEHASDTISRLAPDGTYLYVSRAILPTTGLHERDLLGQKVQTFAHPDDLPILLADKASLLRRPETRTVAYRFRHKDGHYVWLESNIRPVLDDDGNVVEFVAVSRDISARMQAAAQIEFLAHHDPLTGLPNRLLAKDRMEVTINRANRGRCKAAMLYLDLDHFKKVNDSLGHTAGDELLKSVAIRLRECLRETDTLCRQGGDEFLILLGDVHEQEFTSLVAETILASLGRPFGVDSQELSISASIGIAVYPDDGNDFDTLSRRADIAMYHAKEMGRNAYRFFAEQMNVDSSEYLSLRNGLRQSLECNELFLHYQPQFNLKTGDAVGVEALIRWNHPELGQIAPARFIPVAEESGLIVDIGAWVLKEACRQAVAWHKAGLKDLVMAVNLSAVQFKRGDLLQTVTEALTESGLAPHFLELELTESILISDTAKVLATVDQLKELGVMLSIDDFGTGYSCLAYLKRFHVDRLKIDQSFIRHLTTDTNDYAIVQAIVQLARSLGLRTVAEGVEDKATLRSLRTLRCDDAQGYYFAKPMTAPETESLLFAANEAPARRA